MDQKVRKNSYKSMNDGLQSGSLNIKTKVIQLINTFSEGAENKLKQYQQQIINILHESKQSISTQFDSLINQFQKINCVQLKIFLYFTNVYFDKTKKQEIRGLKIIYKLITQAEEALNFKQINQIITFLIDLCSNKNTFNIIFKPEDQSLLKQRVLKMRWKEMNNNSLIIGIFQSQLYNKIIEISTQKNLFLVLLISSIIISIDLFKQQDLQKSIKNIAKLIEKKNINQFELDLIIKIISNYQIREIQKFTNKKNLNITFKYQILIFVILKKIIKQRELKQRELIFEFLYLNVKTNFFDFYPEFFEIALNGLQKQKNSLIYDLLNKYVLNQIKNEINFKKLTSIFKNLRINSQNKDVQNLSKLLQNFELIKLINKKYNHSYSVVYFQSRKSAVHFENLNLKSLFTMFLYVKVIPNNFQYSYLLTLVLKKSIIQFTIKQNINKPNYYYLKYQLTDNKKFQQYEIQLENSQGLISLATHEQGLVISVSNYCFLLPIFNLEIKAIILGNSLTENKKYTEKTAIKQIKIFCVVQEYYEVTSLLSLCKQKLLLQKQLKKILDEQKILIFFEQSGSWTISSNKNKLLKLLQSTENVVEIECNRIERLSLKKILIKSKNIDILFILIEYYSLRLKETQLLTIVQQIVCILISIAEQDEDNLIFAWIDESINKISWMIWILSSVIKQKKEIIQKVCKLIFSFRQGSSLKNETVRAFRYRFIKNVLMKCQIWRNYSFEDQILVYQFLENQLSKENYLKQVIANDELKKMLLSILVYYKLDQGQIGIKKKLSKEEILTIHLFLKQIYKRGAIQQLKSIKAQQLNFGFSTWCKNIKNVIYIAMIANEPEINDSANEYLSKQYFFELVEIFREMLSFVLSNETYKMYFKQLFVKDEFFKKLDNLLFCMIEKEIDYIKKYKKTIIYNYTDNSKISDLQIMQLLQNLLLEILILKSESIENIIDVFQKLKKKEVDFSYYFKILIKLYKQNIPFEDHVFKKILDKLKNQNYVSSTIYICLKEQLNNFIKKCEGKDLVNILNNHNFLELFEMIIPYQNQEKDIVKSILVKYLTLQKIEGISIKYWMHINSLKQYPYLDSKVIKISNLYKIQSSMVKQSYLKLICQNYSEIDNIQAYNKEQQQFCFEIMCFILYKIQDICIKELDMIIEAYTKRTTQIKPKKNVLGEFVLDLLFIKVLEILNKNYLITGSEVQTEEEFKMQTEHFQQKILLTLIKKIYKPSILNNLQKYLGQIPQDQKILCTKFAENLGDQFPNLLNYKQLINKYFIPNIKKYALIPLGLFFSNNKLNQKFCIPKILNARNKSISSNYNPMGGNKIFDIIKARTQYEYQIKMSMELLYDYFQLYQQECREFQNNWKTIKKTNNFWIYYVTNTKQPKSYGFDFTQNHFRSRMHIKTSIVKKDNLFTKFPRRKSNNFTLRFKNSFDNNSSIHLSENQSQGNANQSMTVMIQDRGRKNSISKYQQQSPELIQTILRLKCEYIKCKGIYVGFMEYNNGKITFQANTNQKTLKETNQNDKYLKYSSCEHLIIDQQKRKQLSLSGAKIFTRRYLLRHTAVQIFINGKSYLFNFYIDSERQKLLDKIKLQAQKFKIECIINRKQQFKNKNFMQKWKAGKISNFQYLMLVNTYSGRTYQDISQYPVFPWIVNNYQANRINKEFLENQNNFRDLGLPMGKLNNQRFLEFKERQEQTFKQNPNQSFLYGSCYSNPTIIIHYLIRLQPFATLHWKHQSKRFDHADRLFSNIQDQYISSTTNTSDLKQLIPEFYCFSEFLRNRNEIFFGLKQNKMEVNEVQRPKWAKSPQQFIFRMRQMLESRYVSKNLHKWIDLIFGYKSVKSNAKKFDNLFHFRTYEQDIYQQFSNQQQDELRVAQMLISQFGQIPQALFSQRHVQKQLCQNYTLDSLIFLGNYNEPYKLSLISQGIVAISRNIIYFLTFNGLFFDEKINPIQLKINQKTLKTQILQYNNELTWLQFAKHQIYLCNQKSKSQIFSNKSSLYSTAVGNSLILAQDYSLQVFSIKKQKVNFIKNLNGHLQKVYIIEYCMQSDLIVSVDKDQLVALNYKSSKKFIRHFNLDLNLNQCIKFIRIHPLGLIFFFSNEGILYVYTFAGDRFFSTTFQFYESQFLTQFHILSADKCSLLISTNRGELFLIDIFDIYNSCKEAPQKKYFNVTKNDVNLLKNLVLTKNEKKKSKNNVEKNEKIIDFLVDWTDKPFCKIFILYQNGDLVCLLNKNIREVKIHEQIQQLKFI